MLISNKHEIEEAIINGKSIAKVIVAENKVLHAKFYLMLKQAQIPLQKVPCEFIRAKYGIETGLVALIEETKILSVDELLALPTKGKFGRILLADHIENPQNLGAMIRTCVSFDFDGVILPDRRAAFISEGVTKSSSGAIFQMPIAKTHNLSLTIEALQKKDYWVVGTALNATLTLLQLDMKRNLVIIMGNEDKGMHQKITEKCDYLVHIPISPSMQSLNVSVAFGIIAHELFQKSQN